LLVEPNFSLTQQSALWAAGYAVLVGLTWVCAATAWRADETARPAPDAVCEAAASERPPVSQWLKWVALAFVPSSLMLGVTTHITADIAAVPLLWVIPLALYLL